LKSAVFVIRRAAGNSEFCIKGHREDKQGGSQCGPAPPGAAALSAGTLMKRRTLHPDDTTHLIASGSKFA